MSLPSVLRELIDETEVFRGMVLDDNTKGIINTTMESVLKYNKYNGNISSFNINHRWKSKNNSLNLIFYITVNDRGEELEWSIKFGNK